MMFEWVTLKKAADNSGYTPDAIRQKIRRGQLVEEVHWRKNSNDGRIMVHVENFSAWIKQ